MFYSQFILAKKGPLATIWIAAHLERKLRKNQITETNISDSVDSILYPEVPIALRLSGHLLLGVVRIYSRKVNLLFNDCSEALLNIRQAFQSSAVDLPPGAVVAPFHSITLPESLDFDDLEVHLSRENAIARAGNRTEFEHHVTARDLITLQDQNDDHQTLFNLDERFEDGGNPYAVLDLSIEELTSQKPAFRSAVSSRTHVEKMAVEDDVLPPLAMEDHDFDGMDVNSEKAASASNLKKNENLEPKTGALTGGSSGFPDTTMEVPDVEKLRAMNKVGEQEHVMGLGGLDVHGEDSVTMDVDDGFQSIKKGVDAGSIQRLYETPILREEQTSFDPQRSSPLRSLAASFEDDDILGSILGKRTPKLDVMPTPVSAKRDGRKRKRVFDGIMALSSADMKKQLKSTSDICRARRKAPSTEYEIWMSQRDNHVERKFSVPSAPGLCEDLKDIFDAVINKKLSSPVNERNNRALLRTPKTVGTVDRVDDVREMADAGPGLEERSEAVTNEIELAVVSTVDDSTKKAEASGEAQPGERLCPDPELPVDQVQPDEPFSPGTQLPFDQVPAMDGAGVLENAREQNEGAPEMEHIESTCVIEAREAEDEAVAVAHQPDVYEVPKSQGLGFLADSRDTDEPSNEIAANEEQIGKSSADNSGWSSRTRAVAQYLKEKFEAMDTAKNVNANQNCSLNLARLLTGRTQREAARMFFETLVLGTKGYLQVEQDGYYADIHLLSSQRLLKAIF